MGKVHVGDLLRIGHKLWYRRGCGPGVPGPYGVVESKVCDMGWVRGRHVCRPYTGDLAGVRGNKGNVQRRGKPPPYNNGRLNCSNGKVEGRACPAPTGW